MKTNKFLLAGLVVVMLALVGVVGAPTSSAGLISEPLAVSQAETIADPLIWDLKEDFRVWPNQANPNPDSYGNAGIWSFMYSTTAHDPSAYALITQFYPNAGGNPGLQGWEGPEPTGYPNSGAPNFGMNTTGQPIVMDPKYIVPPGVVTAHPDSSQPAVLGWRSPFTGAIAIEGGVTDICNMYGDGILWSIDKNSSTVASGSIPNEGAQLFKDGTNGNQLGNIPVHQGDFIYFLVAPGGDYYCDQTQLDVTITMVSISKPPAPILVAPANDATVPRARVTLDWSDVPFATHYKLVVKDEAQVKVAMLTVFEASKIQMSLSRGKTYSWYVKACNSGGCSAKSEVWKFKN